MGAHNALQAPVGGALAESYTMRTIAAQLEKARALLANAPPTR